MYAPKQLKSSANRTAWTLRITAGALASVVLGSLVLVLAAPAILRVQALGAAEREAASLALLIEENVARGVLFIDLDRFKMVNDTLGHATGDELLQKVAARLVDCVRVCDVVGRLGGDEFGVVLRLESAHEAGAVATKILHALMEPFDLDRRETFVTASIGITIYPGDAADPGTLLRYADTAMYRAKDDGRNTFRYFTAEMNARAAEKLDLETDLRRALAQREFVLHYQPKIDLKTGAISGVEALLRWQRPASGCCRPRISCHCSRKPA